MEATMNFSGAVQPPTFRRSSLSSSPSPSTSRSPSSSHSLGPTASSCRRLFAASSAGNGSKEINGSRFSLVNLVVENVVFISRGSSGGNDGPCSRRENVEGRRKEGTLSSGSSLVRRMDFLSGESLTQLRLKCRADVGSCLSCSRRSSTWMERQRETERRGRRSRGDREDGGERREGDVKVMAMASSGFREPESKISLPIAFPAFNPFEERVISSEPLIVCVGELIPEFLPTVRASPYIVADRYQAWSSHQLHPPYFAKTPGTPPGTVAVGISRLGGNAAFIGKFGDDELGYELHDILVRNNVETDGVVFNKATKSQKALVRFERGRHGKLSMPCVQPSADMALTPEEVDVSLLDKAEIVHVGSLSLISELSRSAVLFAVTRAKDNKADVSFDLNLPMPLWRSARATRECIGPVWNNANYVKITDIELEFLLSDFGCRKRYSSTLLTEPTFDDEYNYDPADLAPLWHENLKLVVVTDGSLWLHYFTPTFHGRYGGYEDALGVDRSGCGDAFWSGVLTRLASDAGLWRSEEKVVEAIRFGVACSLISQLTYGVIKGLPSKGAATNLAPRL